MRMNLRMLTKDSFIIESWKVASCCDLFVKRSKQCFYSGIAQPFYMQIVFVLNVKGIFATVETRIEIVSLFNLLILFSFDSLIVFLYHCLLF